MADVCDGKRVVRDGHAWGHRGVVSDPLADTRANLASQLVGVFVAHRHRRRGVHDGTTTTMGREGGVHGLLQLGLINSVFKFGLVSNVENQAKYLHVLFFVKSCWSSSSENYS